MDDVDGVESIYAEYADRCIANRYDYWTKYSYAYDRFSDGSVIPQIFRKIYRDDYGIAGLFLGKNIFECEAIFWDNRVTVANAVIDYICKTHPECGTLFLYSWRDNWKVWFTEVLRNEYHLEEKWVNSIIEELNAKITLFDERTELQNKLAEAENSYEAISKSTFWRITKPGRVLVSTIRTIIHVGR